MHKSVTVVDDFGVIACDELVCVLSTVTQHNVYTSWTHKNTQNRQWE